MRLLMFLPFAFLAGADGLVLLVPYVIFMATVAGLSVSLKQRKALAPARVAPARPASFELELEAAAL